MSIKKYVVVACAACGLGMITSLLGDPPAVAPQRAATRNAGPTGPRTIQADMWIPAAPGGAAVHVPDDEAPAERSRADTGATFEAPIPADREAMAILGGTFRSGLGLTFERASRRNVIEHVIAGTVPFGIVSVEPSRQEKELGARDVPIGDFEPCLVVDPANRFHHLSRRETQAILSGRDRRWPDDSAAVRLFAPKDPERSLLLAELLVPGDAFASAERRPEPTLFDAVRGDTTALTVAHRAAVPDDLTVLEIEGFRPKLTLRIVFVNANDPAVDTVVRFCRSRDGAAALRERLTTR